MNPYVIHVVLFLEREIGPSKSLFQRISVKNEYQV